MAKTLKFRPKDIISIIIIVLIGISTYFGAGYLSSESTSNSEQTTVSSNNESSSASLDDLNKLAVKGRAPKTGYSRDQFGNGWRTEDGCTTRNIILKRDLADISENAKCQVLTGTLSDPYTGEQINFSRSDNASAIQIDHVVALSDAWQKGAQQLSTEERENFANDPINLLAVSGPANQQKSDGDAATWLPSNKAYRCKYVKKQIIVKQKYNLWITEAEKNAISRVLGSCTE